MSAIILCFPGFLLADDGKNFWKDARYHANVDALMASLSQRERYRMLDWNKRRFPEVIRKCRDGGGTAA